ncbi:serine/threonine-protein phosphatase 4 regulatory subunit 1-like isoform X3 [Trichogramma pretiosum]|uniref:serine/threonine-protein phosphatase 4 regulatory subunit 1-like isoform X3 n=1 Tax=Trichogramma pretiosum TaxID=7493 RepID=UPI0006C95763|nr:serine/threonine-protein phosphatase 4 regulatory subunit 1-like isoform X3 [Trichogramma pretiosum]
MNPEDDSQYNELLQRTLGLRLFDPFFSDDETSVRTALVECLPHIAQLAQEKSFDGERNAVVSRVLSIVLQYLKEEGSVKQDALGALKMMLDRFVLTQEEIENDVCKAILELARSQNFEQQTMAVTLMTKLGVHVPHETIEKLFLDPFIELCSSDQLYVRRVCASIMGDFCTMMSEDAIYNKLLQTYANLCMDSMWDVRKTTASVMMSVAKCVPLTMRRLLLAKLLVKHLRDESRWVRKSAFEILGPFIATFAKQFYELINGPKDELLLVYENQRDGQSFDVVPVAKISDILTENLSDKRTLDDLIKYHHLRSNDNNTKGRRKRAKEQKLDEMCIELRQAFFSQDQKFCKDEYENFNLFQYYYDPPDMPLDPELVNSIINDNDAPDVNNPPPVNDTEKENRLDENDVKNANNEDNQQIQLDDNKNTEISQPVEKDDKQYDNNFNNEQQLQEQDSNDNSDSNDSNDSNDNNDNNDNDNNSDNGDEDVKVDQNESEDGFEFSKNEDYLSDEDDYGDNDDRDDNKSRKLIRRYRVRAVRKELNRSLDTTVNIMDTSLEQNSTFNVSSSSGGVSGLQALEDDLVFDDDEIVPRILVDYFISMAELPLNDNELGGDLDYHCAFSFPAVVLTLGKDNWHRLKDAYQRLAGAVAWKVRSTLASSIHEIARIIGKELSARDLVPIYNDFINDLDEVRIGALKHLSTFLEILSPQDRMQYLPKLNDFLITDSKWNWRLREELVKQLAKIIELYQPKDVAQYISPLLMHLLQDRVASVRLEALNAMSLMIKFLSGPSENLALALIREMRDLLVRQSAERWIIRQTYALICSKLITNGNVKGDIFARELLPYLLYLANDRVPNVRLVVARTLVKDVILLPHFSCPSNNDDEGQKVYEKLKMMQLDADRDVRIFANQLDWTVKNSTNSEART